MLFKRLPLNTLRWLAVAFATWVGCVLYTFYLDPQIAFDRASAKIKQSWAEKLRQEHRSKIVIYGGSSCAFSIDGERLLTRHQLPVVNMGLEAAMGAPMLTLWALSEVSPGDTLIVALEPPLIERKFEHPVLAAKFSFAMNSPDWLAEPWDGKGIPWASSLLGIRPGAYHALTMLAKVAARAPLYRYSVNDIRESGWQTTPLRVALPGNAGGIHQLSPDARRMFQWLRRWCDANQVRVAYSLPWSYIPADKLKTAQAANIALLEQIAEFFPILNDPRLGAYSEQKQFADTENHLTEESAAIRCDELAQQIKAWKPWTVSDLTKLGQDRARSSQASLHSARASDDR